jgi:hypothetical protein
MKIAFLLASLLLSGTHFAASAPQLQNIQFTANWEAFGSTGTGTSKVMLPVNGAEVCIADETDIALRHVGYVTDGVFDQRVSATGNVRVFLLPANSKFNVDSGSKGAFTPYKYIFEVVGPEYLAKLKPGALSDSRATDAAVWSVFHATNALVNAFETSTVTPKKKFQVYFPNKKLSEGVNIYLLRRERLVCKHWCSRFLGLGFNRARVWTRDLRRLSSRLFVRWSGGPA